MAHEVFISYSSKDKHAADAVCGALEGAGVPCWMAPRDILPGLEWSDAILRAIASSRVVVLLFSTAAGDSPQVRREVERAVHRRLPIIPLRLEDVLPSGPLEYFLSTPHWLDAFAGPLERHLPRLADAVRGHLGGVAAPPAGATASSVPPPAPSPAPPPAPLPGSPLPVAPEPLIGRERELAELSALLRGEVRLVTLTGPGGGGKTRLALQLATEARPHFRDGVWLVPLAVTREAKLLPSAIALALQLREEGDRPLLHTVAEALRGRRALLVLDNFEQISDAAPLVAELLARCPDLRLLVTSRERLHLRGEREVPLPPLALPDARAQPSAEALARFAAVELFVARARAVKPDFAFDDDAAAAVAEICRRLDGLPLALELAAARVKLFSPTALLQRLTRGDGGSALRLLARGARDLPARQQTLRAAIDWSYELLSADERTLFRRLAVFEGGRTLEGIEAVCGDGLELDPLDGVASLVDKSLLRQEEHDDEVRFVMLRTIHEYASERLDASDEAPALRDAHADHQLAVAEAAVVHLEGADQARWLQRLARDHDNMRAALRWLRTNAAAGAGDDRALRLATALWPFWAVRGHLSEGREALAAALGPEVGPGVGPVAAVAPPPAPAGGPPGGAGGGGDNAAVRARALHGAGTLAWFQGDFPAARRCYEASLALWRALGDERRTADLLNRLGGVVFHLNDASLARSLCEQSLALQRRLNHPRGVANALTSLGNIARHHDDHHEARGLYREALDLMRALADPQGTALALLNLGSVAYLQGDGDEARALYEEGLALQRELGDRRGAAITLNNLGNVAYQGGDLARAEALYRDSLRSRRELGDRHGVAISLVNLGIVACEAGDAAGARHHLRESLALLTELDDRGGVLDCLDGFASLLAADGRPDGAARLWGAVAGGRRALGAPLPASERARYEREVAAARTQLGAAAFDACWERGGAMTLDEAVAFALDATADDVAAR